MIGNGNGNGNSISFVNFVVMNVGYKLDPMAKNIDWYYCGVGFITDTDVLGIWVELVFLALIWVNGVFWYYYVFINIEFAIVVEH